MRPIYDSGEGGVAGSYERFWTENDIRENHERARGDESIQEIVRYLGDARELAILDVGCGKGYLLHELKKLLPQARTAGFDISGYAVATAKKEIRDTLFVHNARDPFPFDDAEFDLAISLTALHNLRVNELKAALAQMERVARNKYLVVESYRSELELFNLQCWALTCESFYDPREWVWLFNEFGYTGDYEFIYFE